jgi:hypothetical protein
VHRSIRTVLTATAVVATLSLYGLDPAVAGGATGIWKNCTAFNHRYPHGSVATRHTTTPAVRR